ncbi:hypothetical protein TELCIR_05714 [Teladorsagia circumcincta]|uniref:Uncharacterized protein n=1 Tax=Teladorsagia circumcincta TaxID=45464 RepID=A0A2G9UQC7_TELCI|nr:hypothetical protein TELCIR_05714 [Teladorsagia circumcincta]
MMVEESEEDVTEIEVRISRAAHSTATYGCTPWKMPVTFFFKWSLSMSFSFDEVIIGLQITDVAIGTAFLLTGIYRFQMVLHADADSPIPSVYRSECTKWVFVELMTISYQMQHVAKHEKSCHRVDTAQLRNIRHSTVTVGKFEFYDPHHSSQGDSTKHILFYSGYPLSTDHFQYER